MKYSKANSECRIAPSTSKQIYRQQKSVSLFSSIHVFILYRPQTQSNYSLQQVVINLPISSCNYCCMF